MEDLRPGDVVSKTVLGRNGIAMLEAGTVLTSHYIQRLRNLGFRQVAISRRGAGPETPAPPAAPAHASSAAPARAAPDGRNVGFDPNAIERMKADEGARKQAEETVRAFVESDRTFANLALPYHEEARLRRAYRDRVLETVSQRAIAQEMSVLMQVDQQLFTHTMNVSLLANVAGDAHGWDNAFLQELTVGSLLFDIGMTRLPDKLHRSNRKWTDADRQLLREHTHLGHQVLMGMRDVPLQAARCALLHHERYSGSGYPLAFKGKDIPELAQIVGLADVYDALLSPRHHREPYPGCEALEYLFAAGNYDFSMEIIQLFVKHIAVMPKSAVVLLNNGQLGVVESADRRPAHRPIVRIIREANGEPAAVPYAIDLSEHRRLAIVKMVPDERLDT